MFLTHAEGWWGAMEGRGGAPDVLECHNVIYMPWGRSLPHPENPRWGVYHADGNIVELAAYRRGESKGLVGQSTCIDVNFDALPKAPDALYVYAGPAFSHYGHFVCTTIARLWWLMEPISIRPKLLFHSHENVDELFSYDHFRLIMNCFNLDKEDVIVFDEPCVIEHLIVPGPSFQEQSFVYEAYRRSAMFMGSKMAYSHVDAESSDAIYLTKKNLKAGVHTVRDEDVIVQYLESRGVHIVSPEAISLKHQIEIFQSGRPVFGPLGSAFHTSIFAQAPSRFTCLSPKLQVNSNFGLIDISCGNRAQYLVPTEGASENYEPGPFYNTIVVSGDLRKLASELYEKTMEDFRV